MAWTVQIGSTDVTQYVMAGSVQVRLASDGDVGTARFVLLEPVLVPAQLQGTQPVLASIVSTFAAVSISMDGQPVFSGAISIVKSSVDQLQVRYDIDCQDAVVGMARVVITQQQFGSTTVQAIVQWVISQCSAVLAQDYSYVIDSRAVTAWTISNKSAVDALRDLASVTTSTWYVDAQKKLHWRARSNPESSGLSFGVSAGARALAGSLSVVQDGSALANSVRALAQEASYTTGTVTVSGAAASDDGYVESTLSGWNGWAGQTVASADGANTLPVGIDVVPQPPTDEYYAATLNSWGYTPRRYAPSFPPSNYAGAGTQVESIWDGSSYYVTCAWASFTLPQQPQGATASEIILSLSYSAGADAADSVSQIFVELMPSLDQNTTVYQPTYSYVTYAFTASSVSLPAAWYSPGSTIYLRFAWNGGPPGGSNYVVYTGMSMLVKFSVPQPNKYTVRRAWAKFPTSGQVPAGATITGARLRIALYDKTGSPTIKVRKSNISWPLDVGDFAAESGQIMATVGSAQIPAAGQTFDIQLPATAINSGGDTILCLDPIPDSPPASSYQARVRAYEAGSSYKPQLLIDWQQVVPAVEYTAEDASSIATYGRRTLLIYDPRMTQDQCEQTAKRELALRAWPRRSIELTSLEAQTLRPSQSVTASFSPVGVSGTYIAQDVTAAVDPNGQARMRVTLESYSADLIRILTELARRQ